jgi:hypothetical protein
VYSHICDLLISFFIGRIGRGNREREKGSSTTTGAIKTKEFELGRVRWLGDTTTRGRV